MTYGFSIHVLQLSNKSHGHMHHTPWGCIFGFRYFVCYKVSALPVIEVYRFQLLHTCHL